jgi:PEP-CTERM motif-containing protein
MKKILALLLVFGLASVASAGIINVVTVGTGSMGHAGTINDPLDISETIEIKIVMPQTLYPGWPSYNGALLSSMDLDLHVAGPGTLDASEYVGKAEPYSPVINGHANIAPFIVQDNGSADPLDWFIADGLDRMGGVATNPVDSSLGDQDLVWGLIFHCDGYGEVLLDLTLNGLTEIAEFKTPTGDPFEGWRPIMEEELGDLVIHQIPEPVTMTLLGLGGLALIRRRRA